jgi:hypothetical protein
MGEKGKWTGNQGMGESGLRSGKLARRRAVENAPSPKNLLMIQTMQL